MAKAVQRGGRAPQTPAGQMHPTYRTPGEEAERAAWPGPAASLIRAPDLPRALGAAPRAASPGIPRPPLPPALPPGPAVLACFDGRRPPHTYSSIPGPHLPELTSPTQGLCSNSRTHDLVKVERARGFMGSVEDGGERGGPWARGASDKQHGRRRHPSAPRCPALSSPPRQRPCISTAPWEVRATGTILQVGKTRLGKIAQAVNGRDGF